MVEGGNISTLLKVSTKGVYDKRLRKRDEEIKNEERSNVDVWHMWIPDKVGAPSAFSRKNREVYVPGVEWERGQLVEGEIRDVVGVEFTGTW